VFNVLCVTKHIKMCSDVWVCGIETEILQVWFVLKRASRGLTGNLVNFVHFLVSAAERI